MDAPKNNTYRHIIVAAVIVAAVIVAAVIVAVIAFGKPSAPSSSAIVPETASTSPISTGSSTTAMQVPPEVSMSPLLYAAITASSTYTQDQQIKITLEVTNNQDSTTTFSFTNGCQVLYTIGSFDLGKHITCTPDPTSFALGPHLTMKGTVTHYPSVYKIPPGTYSMAVRLVGYGSINIPITITP